MDNYGTLLEILSWLPVKSLLRFMCVCKNWKTLISSQHFRKSHREKHSSSSPLLIASYNTVPEQVYIYDPRYPDYEPDPELGTSTHLITYDLEGKIVEPVNHPPFPLRLHDMTRPPYQSKLLCFYRRVYPTDFFLYNPTTRQSFLLPNPYPFSSPYIYPPESSPELQLHYKVELGYIPSKDEYIVVHLVKSNGKRLCEVLNISMSKYEDFKLHYNQWRTIVAKDIHVNRLYLGLRSGVFVNGVFYWIAMGPGNDFFLSLDVEKEHFSIFYIPVPLSINAELLEINGELYLANFWPDVTNLVLWKLCSDNKSWAVYWEFDFERLFGFERRIPVEHRGFRPDIFIYNLKYLKGYEEQPRDDQVSVEMGKLTLPDGTLPDGFHEILWTTEVQVAVQTNLFTL